MSVGGVILITRHALNMWLIHGATLMAHMAQAGYSNGEASLIMQMRGTMHRQHVVHVVVE